MADATNTTAVPVTPATPATPTGPKKLDLSNLETFILVDTSGSMRIKDAGTAKNQKRLDAVKESASAITDEMGQYDDDGLTIIRFAGLVDVHDGVKVDTLEGIFAEFRPMGGTATSDALQKAADMAFQKRAERTSKGESFKPAVLIVFTDGAPDDPKATAQVIVNITKKIKSRSEFGILFVQVGNDSDAAAYLDKLNNDLDGVADYDIVAVVKLEDLERKTTEELLTMAFTQ